MENDMDMGKNMIIINYNSKANIHMEIKMG